MELSIKIHTNMPFPIPGSGFLSSALRSDGEPLWSKPMQITSAERCVVLDAMIDMLLETEMDPSKVAVRTFHGVDLVLPGMSDMTVAFANWEKAVAARPTFTSDDTDARFSTFIDL